MAQEQVELLGCPFCGGKAEYFSNAITDKMVNCRSCGAAAFWIKWNTRATPDVRNGLDGVTVEAAMARIEAARAVPYTGGIWEGRHFNEEPFMTIRVSDYDAIRALDVAGEEKCARSALGEISPEGFQRLADACENPPAPSAALVAMFAENAKCPAAREEWREIASGAQFLIDRMEEMDWSLDPEEFATQWFGHVNPPVARLKALLAKMPGAGS